MADQNEVPPQSANCDTARSSDATPNLNASRIARCPFCDCSASNFISLLSAPENEAPIIERRECVCCGARFTVDADGVAS